MDKIHGRNNYQRKGVIYMMRTNCYKAGNWYINSLNKEVDETVSKGNSVNHSFVIDGIRYKFLGFEQPNGKITKERGVGIPVFQVNVKEKVEFT